MSTNTTTIIFDGADADESARPGFWRRLFDRIVATRLAHSEAHIRAYINGLSDERLADLGFAPDRIKAIRAKDGAANSYWL